MTHSNNIFEASNSDAKVADMKTDLRLQATQWLFEASNQLNNVVHELESYVQVIESENSTARMRIEAARKIKRCIIPAIAKVSKVLNEAGNSVAPIGSVRVICDEWERKMKNDLVDADNKWKSVNFQLLESNTNTVKPTIPIVAPREVKRCKADLSIPTLSSPSNGINTLKWK